MNQLGLFAVDPYGRPDEDYVPALDRLGRRWRIKLIQPCTGYGGAYFDEPGSAEVPSAGFELRWAEKEYGPFKRLPTPQPSTEDTAMSNPNPARPAVPYVLRIPCIDEQAAQRLVELLAEDDIDTNGTDGRDVLVPWGGDPHFAMGIAELAGFQGLMHDDLAPILNQITALAVRGA